MDQTDERVAAEALLHRHARLRRHDCGWHVRTPGTDRCVFNLNCMVYNEALFPTLALLALVPGGYETARPLSIAVPRRAKTGLIRSTDLVLSVRLFKKVCAGNSLSE